MLCFVILNRQNIKTTTQRQHNIETAITTKHIKQYLKQYSSLLAYLPYRDLIQTL